MKTVLILVLFLIGLSAGAQNKDNISGNGEDTLKGNYLPAGDHARMGNSLIKAQSKDSIFSDGHFGIGDGGPPPTELHIYRDTSKIIGLMPTGWEPKEKLHVPIYDTIPVLMLVSDSSQYGRNRRIAIQDAEELEAIKDTNYIWVAYPNPDKMKYTYPNACHLKGYEVREFYWPYHPDYMIINERMSVRHIIYLDSQKKPLNENIVVWMSINLK